MASVRSYFLSISAIFSYFVVFITTIWSRCENDLKNDLLSDFFHFAAEYVYVTFFVSAFCIGY